MVICHKTDYLERCDSKSIIVFIPYFGKWPEWIDLFFDSVARNPSVHFLIYTDCDSVTRQAPDNITCRVMGFSDYVQKVSKQLTISFEPSHFYKLCDLRPLFGELHAQEFADYDFYGWCDLDLVFGNIRSFYTDKLLSKASALSTHADRISGHFALFANTEDNRTRYRDIPNWQDKLLQKTFAGLDESPLWRAYHLQDEVPFDSGGNLYFKEQYTTPFTPKPWIDGSLNSAQPAEWRYNRGVITNNRDSGREFLYLHFMNFKSSQWRHDGTPAPWEMLDKIYHLRPADLNNAVSISPRGIHPAG
jgi:hypothetical protein